MINADQNIAIAAATVLATTILNIRPPSLTRSWYQSTRRRRSFIIVLLYASACLLAAIFGESLPMIWTMVYTMIALGGWLLLRQLEAQGSIWSSARVLGITRVVGITITVGICLQCRQHQEILGALSILSGIMYGRIIRIEHLELSMEFRDLQTRLATLEATHRGFLVQDQGTKNGDNHRRAG